MADYWQLNNLMANCCKIASLVCLYAHTHTQAEVDGQNENKMSLPIILRAAGDTILLKALSKQC